MAMPSNGSVTYVEICWQFVSERIELSKKAINELEKINKLIDNIYTVVCIKIFLYLTYICKTACVTVLLEGGDPCPKLIATHLCQRRINDLLCSWSRREIGVVAAHLQKFVQTGCHIQLVPWCFQKIMGVRPIINT